MKKGKGKGKSKVEEMTETETRCLTKTKDWQSVSLFWIEHWHVWKGTSPHGYSYEPLIMVDVMYHDV